MDSYIGRLLDGRYEILEVIGTGGMAVVYKARCHRLNRLVAIKILKDEFARDDEFRRRFRAEGEAVAMLSSPNIVQVYDVSSSDRANFIVMELIDGISLKQYMEKKGSLNWKETLHFAMQIATALEHAHSRGIVHRDIKPHNVMVLKNGSVKVMDFGIARVMSKSNTLTKEALGSVHYISPEQAKGSFTDNRSDLYSLGVVMYEMMTGRPPYDGESPVAVAIQHINGGAVRPTLLNPNIPYGMEQIILKAMALDAADRYASATEMLRDMEEFRQNPEIHFHYETPHEDPSRPKIPIPVTGRVTTAERVAMQRGGRVPEHSGNIRRMPDRTRDSGSVRATENSRRMQRIEEQRRREERSRMVTVAIVSCGVVALIAIAVFLMALLNGVHLNQEKELVEVPYLESTLYGEELTYQYPKLTFRVRSREYNDVFAKGEIISQEPAGGTKVLPGAEVVIVVSMGPEPVEKVMENLVGVTQEEAKAFLEGQGFHPLFRNETSYIYEAGEVTRTDPGQGTVLTEGQTIQLWVSIGPEMVLETVPNLVGMDVTIAQRLLDQLGFRNVRLREVDGEKIPGTVLYQSVEADTEVDVNTEIVLEVVKERENEPDETRADQENPVVTRFVTFPLPLRSDPYDLTIYCDGIMVLEPTVIEPGVESYSLEMKGYGTRVYEMFIDDVRYDSLTVEFVEDD